MTQAKMRTGEDYLRALKDGRRVYVDGELVTDVVAHPAFREAARSLARLFDIAAAPEHRELMTYPSARRCGAPGKSPKTTPSCGRSGSPRKNGPR
jgi:aromatic ring hydroxylase